MQHSKIVGGSTAKRVINCPGSVALVQQMPPQPSSKYADEGTLLHNVISELLDSDTALPEDFLGTKYNDQELTQDLIDEKLRPALAALDEIDPIDRMRYAVETQVNFGDLLPGVFGSTDFLGRLDNKAIVLDWKFGSGVAVSAEENEQLMFYAAAAMRTPNAHWVFDGATEIELIIVQPPSIKRWVTTPERIKQFERELVAAVKEAQRPDARLATGDHCRWCAAKPVCPQMNGAIERTTRLKIKELSVEQVNLMLSQADILEDWIKDLRALAFQMVEKGGVKLPDHKLVAKRATRSWVGGAKEALLALGLTESELMEMASPAQVEKILKKKKLAMPEDITVSISSGSTLAHRSDPRPEVLQLGAQLKSAFSKLGVQ
jgi:hypothetical protein